MAQVRFFIEDSPINALDDTTAEFACAMDYIPRKKEQVILPGTLRARCVVNVLHVLNAHRAPYVAVVLK